MDDWTPQVNGKIKRIQITAYPGGERYLRPGDTLQQKLTFNSVGGVQYTTTECTIPHHGHKSMGKWVRSSIAQEKAEELLELIVSPFRSSQQLIFACDAGTWEMKIDNTEGQCFKLSGSIYPGAFESSNLISYTIRKELGLPDFIAFDYGIFDHIRQEDDFIFCGVEMKYKSTEKIYHYLTDDDSIRIGETVVVPFGRENKEEIGRVKSIIYRPADEAPYPIAKIKRILRRSTSEDEAPYQSDYVFGFCPLCERDITNGQCWSIAEWVEDEFMAEEMGDEIPEFITLEEIRDRREICENCPRHTSW